MATNRNQSNTAPVTTIRPDAVLAPYDPPAEYVPAGIDEADDVTTLRRMAEGVTIAFSGAERRMMRDTITAWTAVGHIVDRIGRLHGGGSNGEPIADGAAPTWAQVKRALHYSPDIVKRPDSKGRPEATIGGWAERTLSHCFDAYRSGASERFNRWQVLCEQDDVTATAPAMFKPNDAKSLIAWSLADTANPRRTRDDGAVIAGGSNRWGSGQGKPRELQAANVETDRLTVAEVDKARAAAALAEHNARVDQLTGESKAKLVGRITVGAVTSLTDDQLRTLALFIRSEQDRRKATPETPVVDAGAAAAEAAGAKRASKGKGKGKAETADTAA